MNIRILSLICIATVLLCGTTYAAEKADSTQTDKPKKISPKLLKQWQKIQQTVKQRAYEIQQTRPVSGVRGAEQEESLLDQLYGTANRLPSNQEVKDTIQQLQEIIKANPKAETVPQIKLWVAQCYAQIGDTQNATKTYQDIIKNHPKSEQAKQAQAALQKQTTSEVDTTTIKE